MKITDDIKRIGTDPLEEVVSEEIHTIRQRQRILSALKRKEQAEWEEENRDNFDRQKNTFEDFARQIFQPIYHF